MSDGEAAANPRGKQIQVWFGVEPRNVLQVPQPSEGAADQGRGSGRRELPPHLQQPGFQAAGLCPDKLRGLHQSPLLSLSFLTCKMGGGGRFSGPVQPPGEEEEEGKWDGAESTLVAACPVPSFQHVPALGLVQDTDSSGFPPSRTHSDPVPINNPTLGEES